MGKKELKWISKHEKEIRKYSGKWVALFADKGILSSGETVKEVIEKARKRHKIKDPFIFKVPRKDEEMYVL